MDLPLPYERPEAQRGMSRGSGEPGRRIYVGNLSWQTTWQELKDHFKQAGEVLYADVLTSGDGRSRGCGVVEFATADQARAAIPMMHDTSLGGRLIFVREDREESSVGQGRSERAPRGRGAPGGGFAGDMRQHVGGGSPMGGGGGGGGSGCKLYVNNLPWNVSWQGLKDHFRSAGNVIRADVFTSADGRSKGCGIVEFSAPEEAAHAIRTLNDTMLNDRKIFVREDRED